MMMEFTPPGLHLHGPALTSYALLGLWVKCLITSTIIAPTVFMIVPLASKHSNTPKMTIQYLNLVHNFSTLNLQSWWPWTCLISKVKKSPSYVLQCLYKLYQCVHSIKFIKNWLFSHLKWPSADLGMAFPLGGPRLQNSSNDQKHT